MCPPQLLVGGCAVDALAIVGAGYHPGDVAGRRHRPHDGAPDPQRVVDEDPRVWQSGERRVEEAVRSHQLDASLAGSLHLVTERDALRRQLPRDVHELRVTRDLRDQ